MPVSKVYIDLTPHYAYSSPNLKYETKNDPLFKYLKPLPKVELFIQEAPPMPDISYKKACDFFKEWKTLLEHAAKTKHKNLELNTEAKLLIEQFEVLPNFLETGANTIIFESQLYSEKDYSEILTHLRKFKTNISDVDTLLLRTGRCRILDAKVEIGKGLENFNKAYNIRADKIEQRITEFFNSNNFNSAYIRFGSGHREFAKIFPNAQFRYIISEPSIKSLEKISSRNAVFNEDDATERLFYTILTAISEGSFLERCYKAYDTLRCFDISELHNLENELENYFRRFENLSDLEIMLHMREIFSKKLNEKGYSRFILQEWK